MSLNPIPDPPAAGLPPPVLEEAFVARWLDCLGEAFGYAVAFPFARVRSLRGRSTRICVPLLAYTHLDEAGARRACADASGEAIQVRYLSPPPPEFAANAPTQSLIPLSGWTDADDFWQHGLSGNIRKKVRRCEREGLRVIRGTDRSDLDTFYALFLETMHRHGTPPFPLQIFQTLLARLDAEIITVARHQDPAVSFFVIYAGPVALFQWAGLASSPGYAAFQGEWAALQGAMERGCRWFDFGRAGFGSPSFTHKSFWRPIRFAPTVLPTSNHSLYDRYRLASAAWRRLPAPIASRVGPRLTPHLLDF